MRTAVVVVMIVVGLILAVRAAQAEPCAQSVVLQQYDEAPCDGVLAPTEKIKAAVACKTVDLPNCQNDLALVQTSCAAYRAAAIAKLLACEALADERLKGMQKCLAIQAPPPPPWYMSPRLWGTTGTVVGVGVGAVITYAIMR